MALRLCTVTFRDVRGILHSVDVEAASLYGVVTLAVRASAEIPGRSGSRTQRAGLSRVSRD